MRTIAFVLAFLAFASHGRSIGREARSASKRSQEVKALTRFLLASNPHAGWQGVGKFSTVPARHRTPPSSMGLSPGDTFPPTALKSWGVSGKNAVVFFYGADDAPSCSKQISAFDAAKQAFTDAGISLIGVRNAAGVKEATETAVPLVIDEGDAVRDEIGIAKDLFGLLGGRETYVLDKDGTVVEVHNNQFDPESHVKVALDAIEKLPKAPKPFWEDFFAR